MSAWRVGRETVTQPSPAAAADGTQQGGNYFDQLIKWIPGDAIALYGAAVTAWGSSHGPSWVLLGLGIAFTFVLTLLSAFSTTRDTTWKIWPAAGLAAGAFTIWSLSIPGSGWQQWDLVNDNQALVALAAGAVALLYALFAQGVTLRLTPAPAGQAQPQPQ